MELQFEVNLIKVKNGHLSKIKEVLKKNCTFVKNDIWIYEGCLEYLAEDQLVVFDLIDTGIVGCLGDLSQKELIDLCHNTFDLKENSLT